MVCPRCGNQEANGVAFCGNCGAAMAAPAPKQPPPAYQPPPPVYTPPPQRPASQMAAPGAARGGTDPNVIGLAIVLVAVGIVAAVLLLTGGDDSKAGANQAKAQTSPAAGAPGAGTTPSPEGTATPIALALPLSLPSPTPEPPPPPEPAPPPPPPEPAPALAPPAPAPAPPAPPPPGPAPPAPAPVPPAPAPAPAPRPEPPPAPPPPTPTPAPATAPANQTSALIGIYSEPAGPNLAAGTPVRICIQLKNAEGYSLYDGAGNKVLSGTVAGQSTITGQTFCKDERLNTRGVVTYKAEGTSPTNPTVGVATYSFVVS
jgi:hypothetical protein